MDDIKYKQLTNQLCSGNAMPMIGFGTFRIRGSKLIEEVLDFALHAGYRSIDTAAVYGNEKDIGAALKILLPKYGLKREDIFITTKLPPSHHADKTLLALTNSLRNLDSSYIDLYLIHWPGQASIPMQDASNLIARTETWKQLIDAKRRSLVKDIGVSNYTVKHLDELLLNFNGEIPVVNQIEWHPHYHELDMLEYCRKHGILLQAYSSLGGTNNQSLLSDPNVIAISKELKKTPSQVLLKWTLQQNIAIIPKACTKEHIENNIALDFNIPEKDMITLSNLKITHKYAWDPTEVK